MSTTTVVTPAAREAIGRGHLVYQCGMAISKEVMRRRPGIEPVEHERQANTILAQERHRTEQDLVRGIAREQYLTPEEIGRRWVVEWSEARSLEADEHGDPVPLHEARTVGYTLTATPRKHPLDGAVYTATVRLAEQDCTIAGVATALRRLEHDHGTCPLELAVHPRHQADLLIEEGRYGFGPGFHVAGVPLGTRRYVPEHTLVGVFRLPVEEE